MNQTFTIILLPGAGPITGCCSTDHVTAPSAEEAAAKWANASKIRAERAVGRTLLVTGVKCSLPYTWAFAVKPPVAASVERI